MFLNWVKMPMSGESPTEQRAESVLNLKDCDSNPASDSAKKPTTDSVEPLTRMMEHKLSLSTSQAKRALITGITGQASQSLLKIFFNLFKLFYFLKHVRTDLIWLNF